MQPLHHNAIKMTFYPVQVNGQTIDHDQWVNDNEGAVDPGAPGAVSLIYDREDPVH